MSDAPQAITPVRDAAFYTNELKVLATLITRYRRAIDLAVTDSVNEFNNSRVFLGRVAANEEAMKIPEVASLVKALQNFDSFTKASGEDTRTLMGYEDDMKKLAVEAAPVLLPTISDKTILRNLEGKAAITVATKIKDTAWNPYMAFNFAQSSEATKGYIVTVVNEEAFKKDVQKGLITPPSGTYEYEVVYEVRLMKDAMNDVAQFDTTRDSLAK